MTDLNYSYRLAERRLLDAILLLAKDSTLPRTRRLQWIAAVALKAEDTDGLLLLVEEMKAEETTVRVRTHLSQAHRLLTKCVEAR